MNCNNSRRSLTLYFSAMIGYSNASSYVMVIDFAKEDFLFLSILAQTLCNLLNLDRDVTNLHFDVALSRIILNSCLFQAVLTNMSQFSGTYIYFLFHQNLGHMINKGCFFIEV